MTRLSTVRRPVALLAVALLAGACGTSATPTPVPAPSPMPTAAPTPSPTAAPVPTAVPTATPTPAPPTAGPAGQGVHVTGTETVVTVINTGTATTVDNVMQVRGIVATTTDATSDPRVSGTGTIGGNQIGGLRDRARRNGEPTGSRTRAGVGKGPGRASPTAKPAFPPSRTRPSGWSAQAATPASATTSTSMGRTGPTRSTAWSSRGFHRCRRRQVVPAGRSARRPRHRRGPRPRRQLPSCPGSGRRPRSGRRRRHPHRGAGRAPPWTSRGGAPRAQRPPTGITGHSNSFTGADAIVSIPASA